MIRQHDDQRLRLRAVVLVRSELDRPVSIEGIKLAAREAEKRRSDQGSSTEPAVLDIEFEVTTYRFLPEAERGADKAKSGKKKAATRRKK